MGLINSTSVKVDIPFEPGEWVKLRLLSGREMDQAADARRARNAQQWEVMAPMLERFGQSRERAPQAPDNSIEVRRDAYDPDTLICFALKDWSYEEPISEDPAGQIDAQTRDWLWSVIVEQNTRPPVLLPVGEPSSKSGIYLPD